jgi:hypothetical protein
MSATPIIKDLGNFRIWEPILLIPFVAASGIYRVHFSGEGFAGQQAHVFTEGDTLLFANTARHQGMVVFSVSLPNDRTYQDPAGHDCFSAYIV